MTGTPKSLCLPGTHGHILPWDPPSFGIPEGVLAELAEKLRQEAIRLAIKNATKKITRSGQSSPASRSDGELQFEELVPV